MESSEISEEFGDWEEIHFPSYSQTSSDLPPTQHIDINIRASEPQYLPLLQPEEDGTLSENALFPSYNQTSSDLPPTQHINLNIRASEPEYVPLLQPEADGELSENAEPEMELPRQQQTESDSPLPPWDPEMELPRQHRAKSNSKLSAVMNEVKTVICARWRRMITVLGSGFKCPTFVPAAALAVAILACMKVVQGRNHLLLLLREKDQRIKQLLHQIAYMKHTSATRRRVPVLRIT